MEKYKRSDKSKKGNNITHTLFGFHSLGTCAHEGQHFPTMVAMMFMDVLEKWNIVYR